MVFEGECIPTCEISLGHLGYVTDDDNTCICPDDSVEISGN